MREAIFHLSDAQLENIGLDDIVGATRDAGLRDVTELVCHGAGGILLVQVAEPLSENDLEEFESVEWWEQLTSAPSGVTYLCKISPPDLSHELTLDEHSVTHDVSNIHDEGFDLSVIGSQDEIGQSLGAMSEAGIDVLLPQRIVLVWSGKWPKA